jgi:hypothetical protein
MSGWPDQIGFASWHSQSVQTSEIKWEISCSKFNMLALNFLRPKYKNVLPEPAGSFDCPI